MSDDKTMQEMWQSDDLHPNSKIAEPQVEAEEPEQAAQEESQVVPDQPGIDPELTLIQREAGVNLYDQDPEIELIDRTKGVLAFYRSVEKAAKAKKERLASRSTNTASRLPVSGSRVNGFPESMTANEMWQRVSHKR